MVIKQDILVPNPDEQINKKVLDVLAKSAKNIREKEKQE